MPDIHEVISGEPISPPGMKGGLRFSSVDEFEQWLDREEKAWHPLFDELRARAKTDATYKALANAAQAQVKNFRHTLDQMPNFKANQGPHRHIAATTLTNLVARIETGATIISETVQGKRLLGMVDADPVAAIVGLLIAQEKGIRLNGPQGEYDLATILASYADYIVFGQNKLRITKAEQESLDGIRERLAADGNRTVSDLEETLEKCRKDIETLFAEIQDQRAADDQERAEVLDDAERLREYFKAQLQLKEPAEYWRKLASEKGWQASIGAATFVVTGVAGVFLLGRKLINGIPKQACV
ncbi:MAG: hypothetical protein ACPGOV_17135 [Magnetovibrionaceae bacterium]